MINREQHPAGTVVRHDKRCIYYLDMCYQHRRATANGLGVSPPEDHYGFILSWQQSSSSDLLFANVLWCTGEVNRHSMNALCVHKKLEAKRKKVNEINRNR